MKAAPIRDRLQKLMKNVEKSTTYHEEGLKIEVGEALASLLARDGFSRASLAKRLRVSPAYVTRLMRGEENLTLRSLAKIAAVTNCRWRMEFWRRDTRLS